MCEIACISLNHVFFRVLTTSAPVVHNAPPRGHANLLSCLSFLTNAGNAFARLRVWNVFWQPECRTVGSNSRKTQGLQRRDGRVKSRAWVPPVGKGASFPGYNRLLKRNDARGIVRSPFLVSKPGSSENERPGSGKRGEPRKYGKAKRTLCGGARNNPVRSSARTRRDSAAEV